MDYGTSLYVILFATGVSGTVILVSRNPGFIKDDFDAEFSIFTKTEFYILGMFLPLIAISIFRFTVFVIYSIYDYFWMTVFDRGPSFAVKVTSFLMTVLGSCMFFVAIALKNSRPESLEYYIFSRMTGVIVTSVILFMPVGWLEVKLYRWHHAGFI